MRIGLMGGTFDPIHIGHLIAGETALEAMGLDEVWFMPANVPPHKEQQPKASAEERIEMVKQSIADHHRFKLCDIEFHREGPSYSIDTIQLLRQQHPEHMFWFIIGADMVAYLPHWHHIEELVNIVQFIGLARPGFLSDWSSLPEWIRGHVHQAPMRQIDVSSTEIRTRLAAGQSCRYLLHSTVEQYIRKRKLYESR